jgi:endo-1,4-beta-xylanase
MDSGLRKVVTFPVGSAMDFASLQNNPAKFTLFKHEFNSWTPENAGKFSSYHLSSNTYNWTNLDALVSNAQSNNMRVHGHTLIWHTDQGAPAWVKSFQGDSAAWEQLMQDHIITTVAKYKGKMAAWDVVNEAMADGGQIPSSDLQAGKWMGQLRAPGSNIWRQKLGDGYLERAFKYARQADPACQLFYNDYNLETDATKRTATYNMIKDMVARGVPIDGIGFQGHLSVNQNMSTFIAMLQQFATLKNANGKGLMIHISELDVICNPGKAQNFIYTDAIAKQQAQVFAAVVKAYRENVPAAQQYGITFWNLSDGDSWLRNHDNVVDYPTIFSTTLQKKAPYEAIVNLF